MDPGANPKWEGLLKWSLRHTDGTRPTRELSEGEREWFTEAMKQHTVDVVGRMKDITTVMRMPREEVAAQGVAAEDVEGMLEELEELVETIDMANDLHTIGGLAPLLAYLQWPEPGVRAKAAEVIATVAQNNPQGQANVLSCQGLESLMLMVESDADSTARTKALGAVSAVVRNNKPALDAVRVGNGLSLLKDAVLSNHPPLQRKALHLLRYLISEFTGSTNAGSQLDLIHVLATLLNNPATGSDVREAALAALADIATQGPSEKAACAREEGLKVALERRAEEIGRLGEEDLAAARDEMALIDSVWERSGMGAKPNAIIGAVHKSLEQAERDADTQSAGGGAAASPALLERERRPYGTVLPVEADENPVAAAPLLLGGPPPLQRP